MLDYSEITKGKFIVYEGAPYEVLDAHVFRKQQRKPVNAVKLRNMITGKITEPSFHVSDKAEEAEIEKNDVKFLYQNKGEYWFCDPADPSNRYKIDEATIGGQAKFMKKDSIVQAMSFKEKIIGMQIPIKMDLLVTEAHPAVKGNTAQGGTKIVVVETGATVNVPMFIKEGEMIRVNTETGEYTERAGSSF